MNFLVCDLSLIDRPQLIGKNDRLMSYEDPGCDANWDSEIHAPISWHGYAAAMNGRIVCAPADNWKEHVKWADTVLALWNFNPKVAMQAIQDMKRLGKRVIGAFHENGDTFQWHARDLDWLLNFKNCANACDAIFTYPRDRVYRNIYTSMGITCQLLYIPQPYYTKKSSGYIIPKHKRRGIFIAPRRKLTEIERRNWIYNIIISTKLIGKKYNTAGPIANRITTINDSQVPNEILANQLKAVFNGYNIEVIQPLEYHSYLKMIAGHQVTINLDASDTQGQTDADSLFVDVPLYQPPGLDFRTDFGDIYHDLFSNGLDDDQSIATIMNDISSFTAVREKIDQWYRQTN